MIRCLSCGALNAPDPCRLCGVAGRVLDVPERMERLRAELPADAILGLESYEAAGADRWQVACTSRVWSAAVEGASADQVLAEAEARWPAEVRAAIREETAREEEELHGE